VPLCHQIADCAIIALSMSRVSTPKTRAIALGALGALFGLAAIYHLAALLWPKLDAQSSPGRHGLFVAIDMLVAIGLYRRPSFFFWVFCLLGIQQWLSHGGALLRQFATAHTLDWQSLIVLLVVSFTAWLLWTERRQTRR